MADMLYMYIHRYETRRMLGEEDLVEIRDPLLSLDRDQIHGLGLVLGLSHRKLNGMEDSRRFLDEMIIAWLRREDQVERWGIPGWATLVKALRHRGVGQNGIAKDIVMKKIK